MEHVEFSLNAQQVNALLEFWPGAARVVDARGDTLAQNQHALNHAALHLALPRQPNLSAQSTLDGAATQALLTASPSQVARCDLGAGLMLEILSPAAEEASPTAAALATIERRSLPRASERPIEIQVLSRGITHELRNPLAAIMTAVSLVQDDPGMSEETLMLLGVIRKESVRMNRILTEFSAYVKPRPPQPTSFNLTHAVRAVMGQLEHNALEQAGITAEDTLPDELPAFADEEHIRQVIDHVLHNAVEAMPGGGILRLEAQSSSRTPDSNGESSAKVLLIVSDSGSGFSGEGLERAFQPFFSSKSQSTGLGLSIARSAVEASGGRIWIENIDGAATDGQGPNISYSTHHNSSHHNSSFENPSTGNTFAAAPRQPRTQSSHGARVHIELPSMQ